MKPIGYLFLILLILGASACASKKITTEAPVKVSAAPKYERKLSNINIPLNLPVKQLEGLANKQLDITLYKDDNTDDDHIALTVTRTRPVTITAENDQLIYTLPVHIYALARYELDVCNICPKIGKSESTQFDITVRCKTALSLTTTWTVNSKTTSEYQWGNKPYVELGPIKIPISGILEPILNKQIEGVSGILDKEIQKRVEIKSKVQKAWTDLQAPLLLDQSHDAWLKITPSEIRVSSIRCQKDEITMKVGIRSYVETFTGGKPEYTVNNKLPNLIIDNKLSDDFQVVLSGDLPYEYASKYMKDEFVGKFYDFENGKYRINVTDAELFGSPEGVTLRLAIDGRAGKGLFSKGIKGSIFMQGMPYYDASSTSIKIKDFDFHFKTKDVLLKTASWLTRIGFKQRIQDNMQLPIKEKLEEARKMVQDGLNKNGRINNAVLLKGNITSIIPEGIYLSPTAIKAVVTGTGNVTVIIGF